MFIKIAWWIYTPLECTSHVTVLPKNIRKKLFEKFRENSRLFVLYGSILQTVQGKTLTLKSRSFINQKFILFSHKNNLDFRRPFIFINKLGVSIRSPNSKIIFKFKTKKIGPVKSTNPWIWKMLHSKYEYQN